MNYNKNIIKQGITFHKITTNKFKTNLFAIFLTTPLSRDTITKNALISAVLRRGTNNIKSQEKIAKQLENMYGATFDCGIDKNGDNHILKFYIESINDEFLPNQDNLAKKSLDLLYDIVFNPLTENGAFKKEYVDGEKSTLKQIIESKIDNKTKYALDRCIEEMYKNKPYGLYKFGYVEDLENINEKDLYEYYKELIKTCKIDVFASGSNIDNLAENELLANLSERTPLYIPTKIGTVKTEINASQETGINEPQENEINELQKNAINKLQETEINKSQTSNLQSNGLYANEPQVITEKMDVTQGKLMMGLDVLNTNFEDNYTASVYNVILGGGANSKLFQNVREKASLAYTAGSAYLKNKNNIIIRCGIEIKNYEKATEIIKKQLTQMYNGEFSDEDIESAKQLIYASLKSIPDTQDSEITYYFSQELSEKFVSLQENIEKIKQVTKEQIIEIAKKVQINTIYFLTSND